MTDFSYEQQQMRKNWCTNQRRLSEAVDRRKGRYVQRPQTVVAKKEPKIKMVMEYKEFKNEDGSKNVKKAEIADYYAFKKKQERSVNRRKKDEGMKRVWEQLSDKEKMILEQINFLMSQQSVVVARLKELAFTEFINEPSPGQSETAAERIDALGRPRHVKV